MHTIRDVGKQCDKARNQIQRIGEERLKKAPLEGEEVKEAEYT